MTAVLRAFLSSISNIAEEYEDNLYDDPSKIFALLKAHNPNFLIPTLLSVSEVEHETTQRSRGIFGDWNKLHDIVTQYEDVLRKRWTKKSQEQRKKILLTAWPNMPTMRRPDFQALRQEPIEQRRAGRTRFRNWYLFHYLNLEDLLRVNNLLLFFHSRGHNHPGVFAHFDLQALHVGRRSSAIQSAYLSEYTMLLSGQTTPETYGQLQYWGDDKTFNLNVFDAMMRDIGMQPGEGLLVLEIQEKLLHFLVRCAELILHDLSPLKTSTSSIKLSPRLPVVTNLGIQWPSVATAVAEAPYMIPIQFDFSRLQSLVNAKRSEAEDHVWSLREDPVYFQNVVNDWSDHRHEHLLDVNGECHSLLGKPLFWDRVLGSVVANAYGNLLSWDLAERELARLVKLRALYGSRIASDQRLPADYEVALYHFSYLLKQIRKAPLRNLRLGMAASLSLRNDFARAPHDPDCTEIVGISKDPSRRNYFFWLVEQLLFEEQIWMCGLSNILNELDRVSRNCTQRQQLDRISPWVSAVLSDLAVMCELEQLVEWHQPRVMPSIEKKDLEAEFMKRTTLMATFNSLISGLKLSDSGTPLTKFNYPSEKRRTAATTEKMRKAENNLDLFWSIVDEHYTRNTGKTLNELLADILSPRELERTPEWIEPTVVSEKIASP